MDLMVEIVFLVLRVCALASSVVLQESSGHKISPSPAKLSEVDPIIERSPRSMTREEQRTSISPRPTSQPNPSPHFDSASAPQAQDPLLPPDAAAPVRSSSEPSAPTPPVIQPTMSVSMPPIPQEHKGPDARSPVSSPIVPVQRALPPEKLQQNPPPMSQVSPSMPTLPVSPNLPVPVASPPSTFPRHLWPRTPTLPVSPSNLPVPVALPPSTLPRNSPQGPPALTIPPSNLPGIDKGSDTVPISSPNRTNNITLTHHTPVKGPSVHNASPPDSSYEPTPPKKSHRQPFLSPLYPPPPGPKSKPRHNDYASPPLNPGSSLTPFYTSVSPPIPPSTTSPPVRTTMPVASHPSKLPQLIHHNSSIPPSILPEPHVSPVSTPLPSVEGGRDIVPVSSSPNPTINITPTQHTPVEAPYVHKAPSSYNRAHNPDSSYVSTPPTISHPPPSLFPLYPVPPPPSKSKPRQYAAPPPNSAPSVHNAPPPDSSYEATPPTKSHPPPSLSPLYPPPPGPESKPRHYAPPPPNRGSVSPAISPSTTSPPIRTTMPAASPPSKLPKKFQPIHHDSSIPPSILTGSVVPPFQASASHAGSPSATSPSIQTTTPSVHNAPPPDSSFESTPPTKSHIPPSLSPLYPPPPGPKSKLRHHAPPPPNPAPFVHNARPPDSSLESTPPTKSYLRPSLSPLYPPRPPGPPWHYALPPPNSGPALPPFRTSVSPAISPSATSVQTIIPILSPKISPFRSPPRVPKPIQALPPPPPNEDCSSITCKEPLTNTLPGTPCNCVMPMQIALGLGVALYTFFPLVSELAFEIASGVYMKPSQVRVMGANADNQDPEKTIVLVDLVPFGEKFDDFTAHQTAQRLWLKQVSINSSLFGDYQVLYVKYPGLPPSPPLPSSTIGTNGEPDGHGDDGRTRKPLGVDVSKHRHGHKLDGGIIAIIVVSTAVAASLLCVAIWVLLFKRGNRSHSQPTPPTALPSFTKSSGIAGSMTGSGPTSTSLSFQCGMACTGSAKTFSLSDMEKATNNFNESLVLGEGGFGRVYSGLLDDGTKVAVKVLKRVGRQGGREFLAEVEMLSRLHHRNLVRLIGFCTNERNLCLVYELVPNGSVQSHLHGKDRETGPLDWAARLKIALGAARGLAYLHEDSSPRVIHRDFKASNILLEHDFTPKVSDFGLARTALDEENRHITTRVMGTFGYLAPEYAMMGHLLVKSDVYSYGVVLLELLSGRKPVDMSMPPGQENLVAWAQPLLTAPESLTLLIDPMLYPHAPFDSIARVAAIASMCVQTEVSQRPLMGEVVQALKLVCTESEETKDLGSTLDYDAQISPAQPSYPNHESPLDLESGCLVPGLGPDSGSYTMSSSSDPLTVERRLV